MEKPAYKRTELQALVVFGIYTFLGGSGSPTDAQSLFSSFREMVSQLSGGDPLRTILFGGIVIVYIWCRTKRKNVMATIDAKLKLMENKE